MNTLIIYATYSGSTMMAAQTLGQALQQAGQLVELKMALDTQAADLQSAELVVLASPSWDYSGEEGMPHDDFMTMIEKFGETEFEDQAFAILGLGDSNYNKFCGAVDYLTQWIDRIGGKLIGQPLKIDQYFMNEQKANEAIQTWASTLKL